MTRSNRFRFFYLFLSCVLLVGPLPLSAMTQEIMAKIPQRDANLIIQHADESYVYLGEELSNIASFISQLSDLDGNEISPLHSFKMHITRGASVAQYDAVIETLRYAESFTQKNRTKLYNSHNQHLIFDLEQITNQLKNGSLTVNAESLQAAYNPLSATPETLPNIKKSFVNIMQVKGLLSVNDEIVQNMTAISLSVNDEWLSGELSVHDVVIHDYIHFEEDAGGAYVGLEAPMVVPASYTIALPATIPIVNQSLRAGAVTATDLTWVTGSGTITPTTSKTIFVAKYGNDTTGNGSFDAPYASLAKAIDIANSIASAVNPIVITMNPGIYIENNSTGPLIVNVDGISIVGESPSGVIVRPNTPANDLLLMNNTVRISNMTLSSSSALATGISFAAGELTVVSNVRFVGFLIGANCAGGATETYGFNDCLFIANETGVNVDDTRVEMNNSLVFGAATAAGPEANTGFAVTGADANLLISGGFCGLCETGASVTGNSIAALSNVSFRKNTFDIVQDGASHMTLAGCTFELTNSGLDIDLQVSGAGTVTEIIGCEFSGTSLLSVAEGIGIKVTDSALVNISGGIMHNYTTAIHLGAPAETFATVLTAGSLIIRDCDTDVLQEGATTLHLNACTASSSKLSIDDATNVELAFFDLDDNGALTIGSTADQDTVLMQAAITETDHPEINYKSALYSTQAIGFDNTVSATSPSSFFALSNQNTNVTSITSDRTKIAGVRLVSDEGASIGGTTALRGWDINKNATSAELAFRYQNSDTVGQIAVSPFTVMQLDGLNNQVQLPTAATQIVFASDTNLYRSSANVLKTDDNFIVGTLTADRAVYTASGTNQLTSSTTSGTELGYLTGVTSPIQTQINSKVAKAGDTMTGTLQLPAGTTALPSLVFTGSTTTGLSASSDDLSFSNAGSESMKISSAGVVSINAFTATGVVHNDASGNLSSSLIVNADIDPAAAIVDTKLATISTAGKVANSATTATSANTANAIVSRDGSGNFSAGTITANLAGNATTATTATNFSGSLAGDVTGTQSATVVSFVGGSTAANVNSATILANAATSADTASAIVRRSAAGSFSTSEISVADEVISDSLTITPFTTAGVLHNDASGLISSSLIVNADVDPAAAIVDTKLATISTAGKVANSATTATSANTASTIVLRDGSGNFSAGTITANLSGNASTSTNFTGSLSGDVTGTQSATVVSLVGGQTAANVASATVLANAATAANTASAIVRRTASGGFSAGAISVTDEVVSNSLTVTPFSTAGIVHNNASGLLSSSLIVDGDITNATISNAKLATISSSNTSGAIVVRDGSGNFAANMITLAGTVTNPTDAATKNYVDMAVTLGIVVKTPALVVSTTDTPITGLYAIDGVTLVAADRVLLVGQTDPIENGLWVADSGAWSRPTDFDTGEEAGKAYVLVTSGAVNAGSSYLCNTPTAIIDTDPIEFALFTLPDVTTGANVGSGTGLVFRNKTGITLNFRSLLAGTHVNITNNANDITLATDATSANTAGTIVARDGSGNFSAGTITANLAGNASTSTNFTGSLAGDVTGTQSATVVSLVGGSTAANVNSATILANAATSADTASAIVRRSAAGSFSTSEISVADEVISDSLTITPFTTAGVVHNDASGLISSSLIVNADVDPAAAIVDTKLATISTAGKVANSATTATSANTANAIVSRDGSGNFSAGTITANLAGNATTATTATNFTGSLAGDVTGTQSATVVSFVGGSTAANVNSATILANAATSADTASAIVRRSAAGSFSTSEISVVDEVISNSLTITPFTTAGIVHNDASGLVSSSLIVNADVDPAAAIVDTKLATISTAGKVANSATTATSANTANTIVLRDGSGNFSAGTITANLTGSASNNVLKAGDTMTGTLQLPAGTTALPSLVFTGSTTTGLSADTDELSFSTDATERMKIDATGVVSINEFSTAGVVHNDASGNLSSSLIVNADVAAAAGIVDTKLATISTAGKVANSATTATNLNTANAIVSRDGSGNFVAGTITANLTGSASNNVLKAGDTMTGTLQLPAGTTALPSLVFTGSTTTGLSADTDDLSFSTDATERLRIASDGVISVNAFTAAGVIHNDTSGDLSSSLIVNADVDPAAAIIDTKLATISTVGKVANSATTATSANTVSTIVLRDASGNFSAGAVSMTDAIIQNMTIPTLTPAGVVHNNASGLLSTSLIVNADVSATAAIVDTKLATISTAGKVANSATSGTNTNTANTLVLRDGTGSFAAQVVSVVDTVVSGDIVLSNSTSSSVGNIFKGSSSFIHNFGTSNTFVGVGAGNFTMSGIGQNSAFGVNTLMANVTGNHNVAIGYSALSANTTGSNNIAIGYLAGETITTGNGNIYINADAATSAESNTIRIGTLQDTCFIAGINTTGLSGEGVVVDTNGQLGVTVSSNRFKHNIQDMSDTSENIMKLRPVTFVYNDDETDTMQYGLIAEEVNEIFPDIVVKDKDGLPYTVRYHILPALLLNELQKQQMAITKQQEIIENMKREYVTIEEMNSALNSLHAKIQEFIGNAKNIENHA